MMNSLFRKTMFLAALLLLVCLLCVTAQADVWQSDSTEDSVTIRWSAPPESTQYYVQDKYFSDWVNNWLYYSNYNDEDMADGIFDDVRTLIPVAKVLSITVIWKQDGQEKGRQVLNGDATFYTITGLTSNSAYEVVVTYKYLSTDEDDGQLYNSSLGSTIVATDGIDGEVNSFFLEAGETYNASELGYSKYIVWNSLDHEYATRCTINMDRDVTVKTIEILGVDLVLTGSGKLTVTDGLYSDPRAYGGSLYIKNNVSLNVTNLTGNVGPIELDDLTIDTTGKVIVKGTKHYSGGKLYGQGGIGCRQSLSIYNGTVTVTGVDSYDTIECDSFVMTGGNVTVKGCEYGLWIHGRDMYVTLGSLDKTAQLNVSGTEAAVLLTVDSLPSGFVGPGEVIIESPMVLSTPAGGSAALLDPEEGVRHKTIVDASGAPAKQVIISVDPEEVTLAKLFVRRCYQVMLSRDADDDGLQSWSDALKNRTTTAAQVINGFVSSDEFANRKLGNIAKVEILYQTMLDRTGDPDGRDAWVKVLEQGSTLQDVINGFCASPEFIALCESYDIEPGCVGEPAPDDTGTPRGKIEAFVRRCYKLILGREPDAEGLKGWSDALESRAASAAQIIDGFVRSEEYANRNLSAGESVDILYKTMLDRAADEAGRAGWVDALGQGYTLQHIINGFCGSEEFTNICNTYGIIAGNVAVSGVMAKREAITPEGDEAEAPVVYKGYASEFINEEKVRAFVEHCYAAVFGREGDAEGVENYTQAILDGKKSPKKVAYEFIFSPEFQTNLPGNEAFIRILYRLYFDREPGAEEFSGWVQMLEGGTSLDEIVNGFAGSDEFKVIVNAMKE